MNLSLIYTEIALTIFAVIIIFADFIIPKKNKNILGAVALVGILYTIHKVLVLFGSIGNFGTEGISFNGMFTADFYSLYFKLIFLIAAALTILISYKYISLERVLLAEYYQLILFSTIGMMIMVSGTDLVSIFIGLELMAISLYVLTGFLKKSYKSNEASMKYLLLGSFGSCLILFGMSLLYGATQTTNLHRITTALAYYDGGEYIVTLAVIMLTAGFGFKIAAVPFHAWCPDVYEGAPTPITAFMSIAPKAAAFAVFLRIYIALIKPNVMNIQSDWITLLYWVSILTMTLGNVVAISQKNLKRMLAYSSIAHAGYMLIGFVAIRTTFNKPVSSGDVFFSGLPDAASSILFYFFVYLFANIGAFAVIIALGREGKTGCYLDDYTGLAYKRPFYGIVMTIFLLSLAGIPPTGGFVGKFYLFGAGVNARYYGLIVIAVLNSAISLYYYMRVSMYMYMKEPAGSEEYNESFGLIFAILLTAIITLLIGIFPEAVINICKVSIFSIF
ncbi:NADH-quinone oxidoreductase subunit N [bacterium]|nr:NADH-quinone oxidoreductase subunit N [bacterium]